MTLSHIKLLDEKPKDYPGLWLSVSKMKTFKDCKLKYKFTYIDRLPQKDYDHLVFGSLVHYVLEQFHKAMKGETPVALNLLMGQAYKDGVAKFAEKIDKAQKTAAYNLLKTYLRLVTKDIENNTMPDVIGLEQPFFVDLGGQVLLNGLIDKVQKDKDNVLHVQDYKTSKSKKYLEKDLFQLKVYAYVKCLQDEALEKVRASYVMLKFDFDTVPAKPKEFSREDALGVEKKILTSYSEICDEKLWRQSPSPLCGYCSFAEECAKSNNYIKSLLKKDSKPDISSGETSW